MPFGRDFRNLLNTSYYYGGNRRNSQIVKSKDVNITSLALLSLAQGYFFITQPTKIKIHNFSYDQVAIIPD